MVITAENLLFLKRMDSEILRFGKYVNNSMFRIAIELTDSGYLQFLVDKSVLKDAKLIEDTKALILMANDILETGVSVVNEPSVNSVPTLKERISSVKYVKETIIIVSSSHRHVSITFDYDPDAVSYIKGMNLGLVFDYGTKEWKFFGTAEDVASVANKFPDGGTHAISDGKLLRFVRKTVENAPSGEVEKNVSVTDFSSVDLSAMDNIEGLNLKLFEYQKAGVHFVSTGNRLLADDMGTGKTVQTLASTLVKGHKYVLVVCPKVVLYNWRNEIRQYIKDYPDEDIVIVDGTTAKRKKIVDSLPKKKQFFLIYSYDSLKLDVKAHEIFKKITFDCVIADEAHYIGTFKNKRREALASIKSKHRVALTGTPFSNRLFHLWGILNFLEPQKYANFYTFANYYFEKGMFGGFGDVKPEMRSKFFQVIGQIMLRRLKTEVLKDLPDRIFTQQVLELEDKEYSRYLSIAKAGYEKLKSYFTIIGDFERITGKKAITKSPEDQAIARGIIQSKSIEWSEESIYNPIFHVINELRQANISDGFVASPKMEFISSIAENYQETKRNLIILTSFRETAESIFIELGKKYGAGVMIVNGSVTGVGRAEIIERFQKNSGMILVATTESVGIGINLTNSDTIVYADQIFDDKKMKQANDRVYRIGQKNNVQIITLTYANTIDDFVYDILEEKKNVVDDWYNAEEPEESLRDKFLNHLKGTIGII